MKKSDPAKLLFTFLGLATFASLVGTISGTLAWYAYSTRASLSYSGTSVNNTVQLQIGIASPTKVLSVAEIHAENEQIIADAADLDDEKKQDLINRLQRIEDQFVEFWDVVEKQEWTGDSNYYYFAPVGSGLTSSIINAYLYSNGYATNSLVPVTSGYYSRGGAFSLKKAPYEGKSAISSQAEKRHYATIPFVFRVIRSNTTEVNSYVEGSELWLVDAQVKASSVDDGNIYKAIRMFIDRDDTYEDDFIMNPTAINKGLTVVGGLLNLNGDHYYDYNDNGDEIIYGEYETIDGIKPSYTGADEIADINGTGKTEVDTFTAKHRPGINYYDNYNNCVFKTAEYESLSSIAPIKDEITGVLRNKDDNHPSSVCKTGGATDHYLGRVDFTIYLEGWDHSVIDEELEHYFDLGLTFEINKLGA